MYLIKILSEQAIYDYENPPQFSYIEQTQFFYLPEQFHKVVATFHTITNKVCFQLCYAYFKACGRFFSPNKGLHQYSDQKVKYGENSIYEHRFA